MLENYIQIIYNDYFGLNIENEFYTDKDDIKFIQFLSKYDIKDETFEQVKKKYLDKNSMELLERVKSEEFEEFFAEKNTLHFTYPFLETFKRIEVLYETIGEKKWREIFGYDYEDLYEVITMIIIRIVYFYNNYATMSDENEKKEYEKNIRYATTPYFTKEEINSYFNNSEEIDRILSDISIDFNQQKNINDACSILVVNEHYYLIFIWDFLYNLYDIYLNKIKTKINIDEFNRKRGKVFENICYKTLKENFPKYEVYKSLEYDYNNGNHEIDILLKLEKTIIVFECKSGAYDTYKSLEDGKIYSNFKKTYGRGYKTINDLNNYIKSGKTSFRTKDGEIIDFDFKNNCVVYVNLSLYNIELLQTNIQKIDESKITPVDVYPICWNFIDFLSLTKVACVDYELFANYFIKRFNMLNKCKNLTFDYDEIDVFGFLTDPSKQEFYNNMLLPLLEKGSQIDMNFMISNGVYREEFNRGLNEHYLREFMEENILI